MARVSALLALLALLCCAPSGSARFELDRLVKQEVLAHADTVEMIVNAATRQHAGDAYEHLAGARNTRLRVLGARRAAH